MTGRKQPDPADGPREPEVGLEVARPAAAELGLDLPADDTAAVEVLLDALSTARASADSYLDDLRRVAAEFDNFRKRVAREREDVVARSSQRVVQALLPVLDSFDQAFAHRAQTPGEEQLLAGVRGTFHQLMDVLAGEGLEIVPGVGEEFDPTVHEATAVVAGGDGPLVVAQELRRGYILKGRLLRPAMVVVGSGPASPTAAGENGE
ncbi:MAG TPA: nucleotide exchange factor GrpE [Acidimicrobiia bacterium]|nr:nucleotide exchange factor GrpE [Acidimicrobiia bacterium]